VARDWANNADFLASTSNDYAGQVHEGFAKSTNRLWAPAAGEPGIERRIEALLADGTGPRALFITGHSKGGALANLAAWRARMKPAWHDIPIRVFTIAAARAGDGGFRQAYDASGIACLRYEDALDIVPFLPPGLDMPAVVRETLHRLWGPLTDRTYEPVGQRMLPAPGWGEWLAAWLRRLRLLFGPGGLSKFQLAAVAAHSLGPGSSYDALICTGEPGCTHS
jgi:hypothetical protein